MIAYLRYSNVKDLNEVEYMIDLENGAGILKYSHEGWVERGADHLTPNIISGNSCIVIIDNVPTIDFDGYKTQAIQNMSSLSFTKREAFLPQYKLENAGLSFEDTEGNWTGIYDKATCIKYNNTVIAFRTEFYRLQTAINSATTLDEVDTAVATENYPTSIVE